MHPLLKEVNVKVLCGTKSLLYFIRIFRSCRWRPPTTLSSSRDHRKKTQVKYIYALGVVLHTIVIHDFWLGWKVYGATDFDELFDATARVQHVMDLLI